MHRDGHQNARFFIGTEVEHSPAFGMKTLFVVGVHSVTDIVLKADEHGCRHIYFGADQSFPIMSAVDKKWFAWEDMIKPVLDAGFLCTLDIDVSQVEGLAESALIEYQNFIPMISVKIPYASLLGYNATVKIDDKDFKATNPGVWCHSLHDLRDRSKFTDWTKYTNDEVLK